MKQTSNSVHLASGASSEGAKTAPPIATASEFTTMQGFDYAPGIHALSYVDTINGEQLCRDDLWLATTTGLDAICASDSPAAADVMAERERQKSEEGYDSKHDDSHVQEEMAFAASCYATADEGDPPPAVWPWEWAAWKPKDRRRNLVRAGAMILAEIERLDRAKKAPKTNNPPALDHVHNFTYEQGPDHRICEVCGADEPIQAAPDAMTSELCARTLSEDNDPPERWLRNRQDKWDARIARKFAVAFREGWVPLLSSDTDELIAVLDRCADNMPLVGVGRGMVEITSTVRGPDEWAIIPELWTMCEETRDKQAAEIVAAKQKVETALACVNSVIENNSFIVGSAIHHNLTVARERLSVAFNGSVR